MPRVNLDITDTWSALPLITRTERLLPSTQLQLMAEALNSVRSFAFFDFESDGSAPPNRSLAYLCNQFADDGPQWVGDGFANPYNAVLLYALHHIVPERGGAFEIRGDAQSRAQVMLATHPNFTRPCPIQMLLWEPIVDRCDELEAGIGFWYVYEVLAAFDRFLKRLTSPVDPVGYMLHQVLEAKGGRPRKHADAPPPRLDITDVWTGLPTWAGFRIHDRPGALLPTRDVAWMREMLDRATGGDAAVLGAVDAGADGLFELFDHFRRLDSEGAIGTLDPMIENETLATLMYLLDRVATHQGCTIDLVGITEEWGPVALLSHPRCRRSLPVIMLAWDPIFSETSELGASGLQTATVIERVAALDAALLDTTEASFDPVELALSHCLEC